MRKIKIILIHILTLSFITISNANASRDIYKQVRKNQSLINDVYRHIITNYVDDIDLDAFTKMSINNMLLELDPYTTYMEKEEKDGIEMLTKGKYGGVGIQIGLREKKLTKLIQSKTGLIIDPYFSATKIQWIFLNLEITCFLHLVFKVLSLGN